jgi:cation transport regulator
MPVIGFLPACLEHHGTGFSRQGELAQMAALVGAERPKRSPFLRLLICLKLDIGRHAVLPKSLVQLFAKGADMPYASKSDLPASIRKNLPEHAQDIFCSAFNAAWDEYGSRHPERLEILARRVAWAAVKRRYEKAAGEWIEKPRAL